MELIVYKPTDDQFIKSIDFNYEELKKQLSDSLMKYKGLVYNDDEITEAKKNRANLNKFKMALDNKRKEIKAQCLAPYEDFEVKVKDLIGMVDTQALEIDNQVKAFEEAKAKEKAELIQDFYQDNISPEMKKILPLEKIWDKRWMNVTYRMGDIENTIIDMAAKVQDDLDTINNFDSPHLTAIKAKYMETLDLSLAMQENNRLIKQAEQMEEYERQKAEKAAAQAAQAAQLANKAPAQTSIQPPKVEQQQPQPPSEAVKEGPVYETLEFRLYVTPAQKAAFISFIKTHNIAIEAI